MKKIKIFKVRGLVLNKGRGKKHNEPFFYEEKVIIGNLRTAINEYLKTKNAVFTWGDYKIYGVVELFTPHIYGNGNIAYWPDDEIYLLKEEYNK